MGDAWYIEISAVYLSKARILLTDTFSPHEERTLRCSIYNFAHTLHLESDSARMILRRINSFVSRIFIDAHPMTIATPSLREMKLYQRTREREREKGLPVGIGGT